MNLGDLLPLTLSASAPQARSQRLENGVELRWLGEGLLNIEPPAPGPLHLLLSAGVHGNETAPVELIDRILREVVAGRVVPRNRALVVLGNPDALRAGIRYLDNDLNRLFNGGHLNYGGKEAERASLLETLAKDFFQGAPQRLHYDLHTAIRASHIERFALYPYHPGRTLAPCELQRLGSAGIAALLNHQQPGHTFTAYTQGALAAESITLELGKARPFGQNADLDLSALQRVISDLLEACESPPAAPPRVFQVAHSIVKKSEAFRLLLPADCKNFTPLPKGYVLAEDGDQRWRIEEEGVHVLFANASVKPGLRAALLVV